jgi:hypothetical protein
MNIAELTMADHSVELIRGTDLRVQHVGHAVIELSSVLSDGVRVAIAYVRLADGDRLRLRDSNIGCDC